MVRRCSKIDRFCARVMMVLASQYGSFEVGANSIFFLYFLYFQFFVPRCSTYSLKQIYRDFSFSFSFSSLTVTRHDLSVDLFKQKEYSQSGQVISFIFDLVVPDLLLNCFSFIHAFHSFHSVNCFC